MDSVLSISLLTFTFDTFMYVCMCTYVSECGGQKTAIRNWFFPSVMWSWDTTQRSGVVVNPP